MDQSYQLCQRVICHEGDRLDEDMPMHMTADDTDQLIRDAHSLPLFRAAIEARLVVLHSGLVLCVLRRFSLPDPSDVPDLKQEGMAALVRAIRGYDPDRGMAFTSYACRAIYQAMNRYLDSRHKRGRAAANVDPCDLDAIAHDDGEPMVGGLPEWAANRLTREEAAVVHARGVLRMSYASIDAKYCLESGAAKQVWNNVVQVLRDAAPVG